jgi:hypothetical protein
MYIGIKSGRKKIVMSQNPNNPYEQQPPDPNATPGTSYGSPTPRPAPGQEPSPYYNPYTPGQTPPDQSPNYAPYNPYTPNPPTPGPGVNPNYNPYDQYAPTSVGQGSTPGYDPYAPPAPPPLPPTQPSSRGLSGRLILLIALALVIIVGGLAIGLVSYNTTQTNNANATATAHANAQTATIQNNLTATGVAQVNATATFVTNPYPPNTGSLALFDPLKDNSKGHRWDENTFDNGNAHCSFAQGSYHIIESRPNTYNDCIAESSNFSNFAYQAEVTILKGDCGGLVFRADGANNKFYYFEVCQDGRYSLVSYSGSSGQYVISLTTNTAINTGLGQKNVIAVVANGSLIQLFVNNNLVDSTSNSAYSQGQIGLIADNYNKGSTEVEFAKVKVWTL